MLGAVLGTVFLVLVLTSCLDLNETGFLNIAFWSGILVLGRIWTSPFSTRNQSATLRMNSIPPLKANEQMSVLWTARREQTTNIRATRRYLPLRPNAPPLAGPSGSSDWRGFCFAAFSAATPFSSFAGFLFSAIQHVFDCTSYPLISSSSNISVAFSNWRLLYTA